MCFINKVGLQSQQVHSGIVDLLGNYQGSDGNEPVTPLRVIEEIYGSN